MTVFRYEWKKNFRYIVCWTLAVGLLILCMTPAYYGALDSVGSLSKIYENSEFFDSLGMTADLFQEPLGMYAFLNVFFQWQSGYSACTSDSPCTQRNVPKARLNT